MINKSNILIFISDQHSPGISEFDGGIARTPNLNDIAKDGTVFDSAYTPCPLCVPARMAFMSGRLPSKTGILNNYSILPDTIPTIAHAFAAAGYETVLIGRMHFVGENQSHGFQHRLVGDITSPEWKPTKALNEKTRGPFMKCFDETGCTNVIGGGLSPVQEYDEAVITAAVEWLSYPHEKPQFIVVGTYSPHFPYVAPLDKYRYYLDKVDIPWGFREPPEYLDPALRIRLERSCRDEDVVIRARAAYCGMIERLDEHVGTIRNAFAVYNEQNKKKGLFVYTSDHGDQCGERGLYAKMSFFDSSARIPLLIEGEGIPQNARRREPVSLVDLVPTLCGYAEIEPPPCIDGVDCENKLHTASVDAYASQVSSDPRIRELVNRAVRNIAKGLDIVTEGRDTTTVIFPEADYKFYFDASPEVRAKRRMQDQEGSDYQTILKAIEERDKMDKEKAVGALKIADNAIYIDTSLLTISQVCEKVIEAVREPL